MRLRVTTLPNCWVAIRLLSHTPDASWETLKQRYARIEHRSANDDASPPLMDTAALIAAKQVMTEQLAARVAQKQERSQRYKVWQAAQREKGAADRLARMSRRAECRKRLECGYKSSRVLVVNAGLHDDD